MTNQSPSENHSNHSSDREPTLHHYQKMKKSVCAEVASQNLFWKVEWHSYLLERNKNYCATIYVGTQ